MGVHILAKTEFLSKQRKKWMSGVQMNVEDAEEKWNGLPVLFLWLTFFYQIPGSVLLFL